MSTPYYRDNHITIYNKDCRDMSELPDNSVQCVVTSPPYWGLRKYAGEQDLIWGGDNHCKHEWVDDPVPGEKSGPPGPNATVGARFAQDAVRRRKPTNTCSLCGAWRGAFGLEPTPEMYAQHTIEILRGIRRVLRKDGVVFWNIGDSYAANRSYQVADTKWRDVGNTKASRVPEGLKPKDLCLIPFRLAIAAQEDGWWVRSVIIWSKLNPMPESVNGWRWERHRIQVKSGRVKRHGIERGAGHVDESNVFKRPDGAQWQDCAGCPKCSPNDGYVLSKGSWRPTESHEYILMLTKTDTYYCDAEAVRELSTERPSGNKERKYRRDYGGPETHLGCEGFSIPYHPNGTGRNMRSVWTFPTEPFPSIKIDGRKVDRHFAVFPEKLPELCIKAATPEVGCCSKCGAPWTRVIKKGFTSHNSVTRTAYPEGSSAKRLALLRQAARERGSEYQNVSENMGWKPACKCDATRVPSLVLDPMMGSGTTLLVAKNLNRFAVGYELSEGYCPLAVERCRQQVLV